MEHFPNKLTLLSLPSHPISGKVEERTYNPNFATLIKTYVISSEENVLVITDYQLLFKPSLQINLFRSSLFAVVYLILKQLLIVLL